MKQYNILVTNDDGIYAKGIQELVTALSQTANVYVASPDTQKSACGHGITVVAPIMTKEYVFQDAVKAWKISGTPADCVKLGLRRLVPQDVKIDMVFSGINHGANLGTDVLYSGTVSGAIEGILLGVPSVAISLDTHTPEGFGVCGETARKVFQAAVGKLPKDTVLNVNLPNIDPREIKGIKVTRLGAREYDEDFSDRQNPFGQTYFWYSGTPVKYENLPDDIDVIALQNGYITITPLHYDLTSYKLIEEIKTWNL